MGGKEASNVPAFHCTLTHFIYTPRRILFSHSLGLEHLPLLQASFRPSIQGPPVHVHHTIVVAPGAEIVKTELPLPIPQQLGPSEPSKVKT